MKLCDLQESKMSFPKTSNSSSRNSLASPGTSSCKNEERSRRQTVENSKNTRSNCITGEATHEPTHVSTKIGNKKRDASSADASSIAIREHSQEINFRKSATEHTRIGYKDKLATTKVPETEHNIPKVDEIINFSEYSETIITYAQVPTKSRRSRKVSIEINTTSGLPPEVTDNTATNREKPTRNSRGSVSKKSLKFNQENVSAICRDQQNSGESDENRNKRKRAHTNSPDKSELQGRNCNRCRTLAEPKGSSTEPRKCHNCSSRRNERKNLSPVVNQNFNHEAAVDSQCVDSPTQVGVQSGVTAENVVECGVCQEKVESRSWISHSHTKHQYLAWHSEEKVLVSTLLVCIVSISCV